MRSCFLEAERSEVVSALFWWPEPEIQENPENRKRTGRKNHHNTDWCCRYVLYDFFKGFLKVLSLQSCKLVKISIFPRRVIENEWQIFSPVPTIFDLLWGFVGTRVLYSNSVWFFHLVTSKDTLFSADTVSYWRPTRFFLSFARWHHIHLRLKWVHYLYKRCCSTHSSLAQQPGYKKEYRKKTEP